MPKILVTGGAGFVGSHLIQELIKVKGNQLYSLDNYSSGSTKNHIKGATYIKGDTKDIATLVDFIPSIVYHLGEYSRTSASFENPALVWEYNSQGTFNVVEYCRTHNIRLVYAGSSTKMADKGEGRNQSPYAWTKATNIDLLNRYGQWFNLNFVIVYFYNVYGGRQVSNGEYATVIGTWKEKVRNGEKLPLVSPGTQQRTFTHISDIVKGIILAAEKGKGDGYPLGAKEVHTLFDLAKLFGAQYEMLPERKGDRKTVAIDLSQTEADLGWHAQVKLEDHIKQFVASLNK